MAASIYPVKKSFGPFVLQELAHYKSARRIMKKKDYMDTCLAIVELRI